jgi:transcriptional regulator with XRE-family HTH domain
VKATPSRAARERAGLTLQQAARRFSVQPATLAMWERNQTRFAWTYRRALEGARLYSVPVTTFMRCHEPATEAPEKKRAAVARQRRAA